MLHVYFYEKLGNLSREKNRRSQVIHGGANSPFVINMLRGAFSGLPARVFWCFILSLCRHRTQMRNGDVVALEKEHCSYCAQTYG